MAKLTDQKYYKKTVAYIIDNLEGGYYHPDMLNDGRIKDARYGNSGETMFGIDRLRGGTINETPAGRQFWSIIDNSGARYNWKWNYKGGNLAPQLKELVAEMMYPQYVKLSERYLSEKSKKIIESDERLFFNYVYATWNGSGWFQKFATKFNEAVASGTKNKNQLADLAVAMRKESTSSLVRQGGAKIETLMGGVPKAYRPWLFIGGSMIILGATLFILVKKKIIKF